MSAHPPDPDPADVPDLEPGGSVTPGDTPPDSASTSGTANKDPKVGRSRITPTGVVAIVGVVILALLFLATGILMIGRIIG
jgi:hypothetical protein